MPAKTAGTSREKAPAPAASRPSRRRRSTKPAPLQTFAEATGSRDFVPRGPEDEQQGRKSFYIRQGTIERLKATSAGIQHRAYDTELADRAPESMSAAADEAINALCTFYENTLNNGEEFPRRHRLPPGPSFQGAARGAAKRSAQRAED
jgi:hypothetical protein